MFNGKKELNFKVMIIMNFNVEIMNRVKKMLFI